MNIAYPNGWYEGRASLLTLLPFVREVPQRSAREIELEDGISNQYENI